MKKFFTLIVMLVTTLGMQAAAPANFYIFGNAPFGGSWVNNPVATKKCVAMTKSGNTFTWSGTVSNNSWFSFCSQDGTSWDDMNNNYRYGLSSDGFAPTLDQTYTLQKNSNSIKLAPGDYTITVDFSGTNPTVKFSGYQPEVQITSFTVVGDADLFGTEWDTDGPEMEKVSDTKYTYTIPSVTLAAGTYEYKATANHDWGYKEVPSSGNNTLTIVEAGTYKVVFTLDLTAETLDAVATKISDDVPEDKIIVRGSYNDWDEAGSYELEETSTGIWTGTVTLEAGGTFKIWNKGTDKWYGGQVDGDGTEYWVTEENHTDIPLVDGKNFYVVNGGDYTITVNLPALTLTVEGNFGTVDNSPSALYLFGDTPFGGWSYTPIANGTAVALTKDGSKFTWTGTVGADAYFGFTVQDGESWDDLNANYRLGAANDGDVPALDTPYTLLLGGASLKIGAGSYTFTVDYAGASPTLTVTSAEIEDDFVLPEVATYVEGKTFAYFEKPATWGATLNVWAWGDFGNVYNEWPGSSADVTYVGTRTIQAAPGLALAASTVEVYRWVNQDDTQVITGVIFNDGTNQTSDLTFSNGGYYQQTGLKAVVPATATGINDINSEATQNGKIYTVQGLQVKDMSQKGLYIVNGKKILVK